MRYFVVFLGLITFFPLFGCGQPNYTKAADDAKKELIETVSKFESVPVHVAIGVLDHFEMGGGSWSDNDQFFSIGKYMKTRETQNAYRKWRTLRIKIAQQNAASVEVKNQAKQNKIKKPSKSIFD